MTIDPAHPDRPVLIVPFVWIGDFVRCHSVVRLLKAEAPGRPVDMVSSTLCAPLADYMPGVRQAVISDQPRKRLGWAVQRDLAARLRRNGYGQALIMSRKWKAALAPAMAGIPIRTGFAGEARFGLLTDIRWGEHLLPRMIDQMGALALPKGCPLPAEWPLPELTVPAGELARWRELRGLADEPGPIITLSPGAVGAGKAWPPEYYAALAKALAADGASVWVLGGPAEKAPARLIAEAAGPRVRDLTGNDLRNAVLALAAADVSVTNDSGLMHVSAALDAPTVAIFGPTSPYHWAPLNGLAATMKRATNLPCQPCHKPVCTAYDHHCMRDITANEVVDTALRVMAEKTQNRPVPVST